MSATDQFKASTFNCYVEIILNRQTSFIVELLQWLIVFCKNSYKKMAQWCNALSIPIFREVEVSVYQHR